MFSGCCLAKLPLDQTPVSQGIIVLDPQVLGNATSDSAVDVVVETEVAVMRSETVLREAIIYRSLNEHLGVDEDGAYDILRDGLSTSRVDDSLAIRVVMAHEDPETAAIACNSVLGAYLNQRMDTKLAASLQAIQWLEEQLDRTKTDLDALPAGDPERQQMQKIYDKLHERFVEAQLESSLMANDARVLEPCELPR
ncbi:MAG: hypothetical protein HN348_13030 [Proteobacteria bacterium]|jgi:hypothetical protein|nr:hypothetical protein [Pseudomonadota bacterium]